MTAPRADTATQRAAAVQTAGQRLASNITSARLQHEELRMRMTQAVGGAWRHTGRVATHRDSALVQVESLQKLRAQRDAVSETLRGRDVELSKYR